MEVHEAKEWFKGTRSMHNLINYDNENVNQGLIDCAKADATMMEQAYWALRAYNEGLIEVEE